MTFANATRCAGLVFWGLGLSATLSIANWQGDWGHSFCGVWGCGPPLQTLVACHASWVVVLFPMAVIAGRCLPARVIRAMAVVALMISLIGLMSVAIHEYLTWYDRASVWQRSFYGRRVGFVVVTTVELPLAQTVLSVFLMLIAMPRHRLRPEGAVPIAVPQSPLPESDRPQESRPAIPSP